MITNKITINSRSNVSLILKRMIRSLAKARNNCPIVIVGGKQFPKLCGEPYHYTNKRGDIIRHPNAYKKAWGKPIYHHSTIRVEVGSDWLLKEFNFPKIRKERLKVFK